MLAFPAVFTLHIILASESSWRTRANQWEKHRNAPFQCLLSALRRNALESGNKQSGRCAGNVEMHYNGRNFIPTTKALSLLCDHTGPAWRLLADFLQKELLFFVFFFLVRRNLIEQMALSTKGIFTLLGGAGGLWGVSTKWKTPMSFSDDAESSKISSCWIITHSFHS